ncbi:MAG: Ig-like domain-containing protein [Proteobacteria bacterium]|nr:Ig-like domain-containing protein [Pseudomonadota bacterium]
MKSNRIMTIIMMVWIVVFSLHIISCGQKGERPGAAEETDSSAMTAQSMSVSLSQPTVKTDDSDSCTITVMVLDKDRVGIPDLDVGFSAAGGRLSASTVTTDSETAKAEVLFSAGPDKENKIVTVTVSVKGLTSVPVPIQLVQTTITLESSTTNLQIGGSDSDTITLTLKDAGDAAISDEDVTVKIDSSSTGNATLSCVAGDADCSVSSNVLTLTTDFNGQAEFNVQGTSVGNLTIMAEALGAKGSATYAVGIKGTSFGISFPTADPYSLSTNTAVTVVADAPGVSSVRFATTLGTWDNGALRVVEKAVSGGSASAVLKSTIAGIATVQIFDVASTTTQDSISIAISAPTSEASQVDIQASPSVVALSLGDLDNKATLTAIVKNNSDQPVGGAPVAFSIVNPIGGGEKVYPVISITDSYGIATTTFTSGSLSSDSGGIEILAEVLVGSMPTSSTSVKIGGTAGSISIGYGTTIETIDTDTAYRLPMSVIVTDANGNPVKGTKVSLSVWPSQYRKGYWEEIEPGKCVHRYGSGIDNEDDFYSDGRKRNLILDEGEDLNEDGQLTPMNAAAGELPSTVTTDDSGKASFALIYLKTSAAWIEVEITASTLVLGNQNISAYSFWLPWLAGEECPLPNSPYGTDTGEAVIE